jgi:membrane protease YdiL (CAAX protease family)
LRALAWFLAAIFGSLLAAALLAWPLWQFTQAIGLDFAFHRVVSRFWQFLLLAGLLLALRRLRLRGHEDWGYGLPRPEFLRQAALGLAVGIATMLPMTIAMLATGIREPRAWLDAAMVLEAVGIGLLAGLVVAVVEETFFRGLMFRAVSRERGVAFTALSTTLVYAAIHFFARTRVPADEVAWASGFRLLGGALANFTNPLPVLGSFVTLVLVGLLLARVRERTGAIAACIGLHMGWVFVIKATKSLTLKNESAEWAFLVGPFDGYTGWLVAGWGALLILLAWASGWLGPARARSR